MYVLELWDSYGVLCERGRRVCSIWSGEVEGCMV